MNGKYLIIDINTIKEYELNNKDHPEEQLEALDYSIMKVGFRAPILIDEKNIILAGHGRLLAAKKAGMKEVPVIQYSDMTEEQKEEYRLLDNIIAEKAKDNLKNIEVILQKLNNPVLNEMYADKELNLEMLDVELNKEDEDTVPEPTTDPIVKYGDIFQLGEHRLMCGDATKKEDMDKLLNGATVQTIFTDPPYNVNYKGSGKKTSRKILNDHMDESAFLDFLQTTFKTAYPYLTNTGASYIFHSHSTQREFQTALEKSGFEINKQLIWNKPGINHVGGDYKQKHEPFFYANKKGYKADFYGDVFCCTTQDFHTMTDSEILAEIKKRRQAETEGKTTIRSIGRHNVQQYEHPTQKPVRLVKHAILNSTKTNENVLDMFGGSGTTLIACEDTKRVCYMMELDPAFCEVIIKRYSRYIYATYKKPIKCINRKLELSFI